MNIFVVKDKSVEGWINTHMKVNLHMYLIVCTDGNCGVVIETVKQKELLDNFYLYMYIEILYLLSYHFHVAYLIESVAPLNFIINYIF